MATPTMHRSPHGLDSRGEHWDTQARCSKHDVSADWWLSERNDDRARAAHICRSHCPVLALCDTAARRMGREQRRTQVLGGVVYSHTGNPTGWAPAKGCQLCSVDAAAEAFKAAERETARVNARRRKVAA